MSRRALVTGGAGFIGSHLVDALVADGLEVVVVDTMEFAYPGNLDQAMESGRVTLRRENCADDGWQVGGEFDEIYHMAGLASTADFTSFPVAALRASVWPLVPILNYKSARPDQVKVLFASSSEVYGRAEVYPQPETYDGLVSPNGPRAGYDEGKRAAEALIAAYTVEQAHDCAAAAIVRIFNTYGPRMRANGRLVPAMVSDALGKGAITVNEPGTQTRTLLDYRDCVRALRLAIDKQHPEPINVGGVETLSVAEIADRIASYVAAHRDGHIDIQSGPPAKHEVMRRRPELSRAKEVLGWEPTIPLAKGIEEVIDYWVPRLDSTDEN